MFNTFVRFAGAVAVATSLLSSSPSMAQGAHVANHSTLYGAYAPHENLQNALVNLSMECQLYNGIVQLLQKDGYLWRVTPTDSFLPGKTSLILSH